MNHFLPRKFLRMKIAFLFSLFALLVLSASPVLAADYNVAVFFTGNINGSFSQPTGGDFFEGLDVSTTPDPGFELLIKPTSRFSFGVAYQRLKFDPSPTFHQVVIEDSFGYLDAEGKLARITMPGTEFASYDLNSTGDLNIVTGIVYLNLTTGRNVQPFIGGGYGIGFGNREFRNDNIFVHPLLAELQGFAFQLPASHSVDTKISVITAKFGVNAYFKNFVIGGVGGYQNGPLGQVRIGVAF